MMTNPRFHLTKILLAIILLSTLIGLIIAEVLLRAIDFEPEFPWQEWTCFRSKGSEWKELFVLDPEFGFRPILGAAEYNEFGAKRNQYEMRKKPNITRLLFLGDSVTARGKIINSLKQLYGEEKFEYWNAGVESFNTVQEVKFYETYNWRIKPDKVILFFHNNDFETTPVAFLNNSRVVVYAPSRSTVITDRWLFEHSAVYRTALASQLKFAFRNNRRKRQEIKDEVKCSIKRLKKILDRAHIELAVVVLPVIDSYDRWNVTEKDSRSAILGILNDLGIKHVDLTEVVSQLAFAPVDVVKLSTDNDRIHPEDKIASLFADFLYKKGILGN